MRDIKYPTPWEWSDVWNTKGAFISWLRGQLRSIWKDYPVRIEFIDESCLAVTSEMREKYNLHRQTKKAGQCVFCKQWFAKSKLEVDHIIPVTAGGSLTELEDIERYLMEGLLCGKDNMQLACKPCHKIKSYADKQGITFQQASLEKKVIEWCKKPTQEQKELLQLAGFEDEEISNANKRREAARKLLTPDPD